MNGQIEFVDLPYETQKHILDKLDEKDHISMFRVSKSWQFMIGQYMNDKSTVKPSDWRWFCRHNPKVPHCSKCLTQFREKCDANEKNGADDWNWWM